MLIQQLNQNQFLHQNPKTGITWVEDISTGLAHSCHPNIHASGSPSGMKKLGYWQYTDWIVKSDGYYYNLSSVVISDQLDAIAAENCQCQSCRIWRKKTSF